jgi:hypothetical protein
LKGVVTVSPSRPINRCFPIPGTSPPRSPLPAHEDAWQIIERFARDIPGCDKSFRHKLVLEAVRNSICAEVVYWYPGSSGDAVERVGSPDLPAAWCVTFAKKLIDGTPGLDGRLLRSALPVSAGAAPFHPSSAALVRVSRSQATWIVALQLTGNRCLQATDLQIMALIRQIYVNQRRANDLTGRMTDTLASLVQCLTTSIDAHLPHTRGHSDRVAKLAVAIGKRMRLPSSVLHDLYFAGLVHDIGITSVSQTLLLKPTKLTEAEFAEIKAYPVLGDSILSGIKQLGHLRPAVRHHHERYDGRGYPDGLAGDEIPLLARILGVADAFDAMRSPRPYRPPLTLAQVDDILARGAGQQWDPCVVEHYLHSRPHFQAFREPVTSPSEPALQYVVPAASTGESSDHAPVRQP